jgi:hypothetical protein
MSLSPNYRPAEQAQLDNFGADWVVHYEFGDLGRTVVAVQVEKRTD